MVEDQMHLQVQLGFLVLQLLKINYNIKINYFKINKVNMIKDGQKEKYLEKLDL